MSELTASDVYRPEQISAFYEAGQWTSDFVTDYLDRWTTESPDRVFAFDGDTRLTWGELQRRSLNFAAGLRELGVASGDRIGVQLPNWHEFVICYLGLARLGAVLVPIVPVYREHEVAHMLGHTNARAYVFTPSFRGFDYAAMAQSLLERLPELQWTIAVRADSSTLGSALDFASMSKDAAPAASTADFATPDPDAVHLIGFTSGTESMAKGCAHTWNTYSFTPRTQRQIYNFTRDDIELVPSPITHTSGLAAGLLKPLISGGAICLMDVWEPGAAAALIDTIGCTQVTGATPFLTMLLDVVERDMKGAAALKVFTCGGAPVPAAVVERTAQLLPGCRVCTAFGQTETLLCTTTTLDDDFEHLVNTDGSPIPGVTVAILDANLQPAAAGEIGEICYRTPGQMLGYWRNDAANNALAVTGDLRRTGDLGMLRPDGYLRVTGRLKDMLIRGGLNISAREVEEALLSHPSVAGAAVVGVPDKTMGERVGAAVTPAPGHTIDTAALIVYLRDELKMAKQKLPEQFVVLDGLPMNATGKVLKFELVKRFATPTS